VQLGIVVLGNQRFEVHQPLPGVPHVDISEWLPESTGLLPIPPPTIARSDRPTVRPPCPALAAAELAAARTGDHHSHSSIGTLGLFLGGGLPYS